MYFLQTKNIAYEKLHCTKLFAVNVLLTYINLWTHFTIFIFLSVAKLGFWCFSWVGQLKKKKKPFSTQNWFLSPLRKQFKLHFFSKYTRSLLCCHVDTTSVENLNSSGSWINSYFFQGGICDFSDRSKSCSFTWLVVVYAEKSLKW